MRRLLAVVLALFLITAPARTAHANHDDIGTAFGFFFLFILDTAVSIGGTVTGIGTSVQLSRERPALGWSIAALVLGGIAGLFGAITTGALIGSDIDDGAAGLWTFAAVPLALCALNLSVGIVNLSRRSNAPLPDEEEYEYEDQEEEWGRASAPGVVLSFGL